MGNQASGGGEQQQQSAGSSKDSVSYTSTQANGTGTMTQARRGTPVILNVYEPAKGNSFGFGIYHTGIEFNGVEYSFAGGPNAGSGTGVMTQQPRASPPGGEWKFKQALELGTVAVDHREFERVLQELKDLFPANTYDLIHRNCNHFTTAVAKRLGVHNKYPGWINRAASWGAVFQPAPAHLKPLPAAPPPKESVFKSTTGYSLASGAAVVQPPKKDAKGAEAAKPAAAAASSSGGLFGSRKAESKQSESTEQKKGSGGGGGGARKNPWADPNFIPPGMRKDPVVATGRIDA